MYQSLGSQNNLYQKREEVLKKKLDRTKERETAIEKKLNVTIQQFVEQKNHWRELALIIKSKIALPDQKPADEQVAEFDRIIDIINQGGSAKVES